MILTRTGSVRGAPKALRAKNAGEFAVKKHLAENLPARKNNAPSTQEVRIIQ